MSTSKFVETHNLVAFLEKPAESNGFEEIIDFLNTSSVQYALTVNPTIYTTCIEKFWTSSKVKTVNGERQIQALVDKKKVIIIETSIRSDLKLDDAEGTNCLPTATIFLELERMGAKTTSWNEFSSTMASAIICLATNKNFNFFKYIFDNTVKNLEGGVKYLMYPRFVQVFLDKQVEGMSKHKGIYVIPSYTKMVFANMKRPGKDFSGKVTPLFETMMVQATEDMEPILDEAINEEHVATPFCDPPQSGKDRIQLIELMDLCTQLQSRVLALETTKSNQVLEIKSLKRRVKSLEKRRKSITPGFKRLKKGRKIVDLDADAEEKEVVEKEVSAADPVTTASEVVTTTNVEVTTTNAPTTTIDELTLAQTLMEIKAAKPKAITSATTTTTTTRPKARGVAKDKGKVKMIEPEKPLKKKDQIAMDEEVARNLEAQLQAELEKEERISRLKEEKANIALLKS
ncbi:hypothetical protein Tco_0590599 [Tanacetum coccineum]